MKEVLDGLQLAYKITANSLYGQVGAKTSKIYLKDLAASTTATGRNLILRAKSYMEKNYNANIVYGDTDSIFIDFHIRRDNPELSDKEVLQKSIDLAIKASGEFKKTELKHPHDLEYEKTFYPFIILSKKKYIGNLYEHDVNKFKEKSMGIVLKRRDNANILKIIYGGVINIILNEKNITKAIQFLKSKLNDLINQKIKIEDLIITKTLRGYYKDPKRISHKVLADRMKERDPGSAPQSNDRIPYVYILIKNEKKNTLQGDKIEHPNFIIENNIEIDYQFYITNQIKNPICQLLALTIENIPRSSKANINFHIDIIKKKFPEKLKQIDEINKFKANEVEKLIFQDLITKLNNKKNNHQTITDFFHLKI